MIASKQLPPSEHDYAIGSQVDELSKRGLDSALKLSLLSEAWTLALHEQSAGHVTDFVIRLGYSDDTIRQGLDQLTRFGYLCRSYDDNAIAVYRLTELTPSLDTIRRLLSSWRDLRFYLRANDLIAVA